MKISLRLLGCLAASGLMLFSCKEKPKTEQGGSGAQGTGSETSETKPNEGDGSSDKPTDVEREVKEVEAPVIEAKVGNEERAAKLGFARYLPADTEMLVSVYNSKDLTERFKSLKLFRMAEEMWASDAKMEMRMEEAIEVEQGDEEAIEEDEVAAAPDHWTLLGLEVSVAMGGGTGAQLGNMMEMLNQISYYQMNVVGKSLEAMGKAGDMDAFNESMEEFEDPEAMIATLLSDEVGGMELFEKFEIPTIYVSFRAKEGELAQAAQMVGSVMDMFGSLDEGMAAVVEFETGGGKFSGYKLLGSKLAEEMEKEKDEMVEALGAEKADQLIATLAKKNLVMVTGTVGDYVVLMVGSDEAKMKLADTLDSSMVSGTKCNFVDEYVGKQLISVLYGDSSLFKDLIKYGGAVGTYAEGLRDGMMQGDGLGDIRDITELLQLVVERENDLLSMSTISDSGTVIYLEDGVKIDSFGGIDSGNMNWDYATTLAHLGKSPDNLMFMNFSTNEEYKEKAGAYFETLFEMAYAVAMKLSEMEIEDEDFQEAQGYIKMFDEKFRENALGIYNALSGEMADALGKECAVIVDLKGSMPEIPGMPEELFKEGKGPRVTILSPVTERVKLGAAWSEINSRTTKLLSTISEMAGQEIPMQAPESEKAGDVTTWFMKFPGITEDFKPSISISDKWFAASTSKSQALDLIAKADAGGEKGKGLVFYINFDALSDYGDEMLAMFEKNVDKLLPDEGQVANFNQTKGQIKQFMEAFREFESISWTSAKEGGQVKTSIHFKTR